MVLKQCLTCPQEGGPVGSLSPQGQRSLLVSCPGLGMEPRAVWPDRPFTSGCVLVAGLVLQPWGRPGAVRGWWTAEASSALMVLPHPLLCFLKALAEAKSSLYRPHVVPVF